jgi:hypothetical protein
VLAVAAENVPSISVESIEAFLLLSSPLCFLLLRVQPFLFDALGSVSSREAEPLAPSEATERQLKNWRLEFFYYDDSVRIAFWWPNCAAPVKTAITMK